MMFQFDKTDMKYFHEKTGKVSRMTQQPTRGPALPDFKLSAFPPCPRSSGPSWMTIDLPSIEFGPSRRASLSWMLRIAWPELDTWMFPRSPTCLCWGRNSEKWGEKARVVLPRLWRRRLHDWPGRGWNVLLQPHSSHRGLPPGGRGSRAVPASDLRVSHWNWAKTEPWGWKYSPNTHWVSLESPSSRMAPLTSPGPLRPRWQRACLAWAGVKVSARKTSRSLICWRTVILLASRILTGIHHTTPGYQDSPVEQ